jgi:uracil-DNA glycosylase family 4
VRSGRRRAVDRPAWLPYTAGWPRPGFAPGCAVRGYAPLPESRFAIVGEGPGWDEAIYGYPMIGATGQEVDRHLQRVGLHRRDALVTNVTVTVPTKKGVLGEPNPDLERELAGAGPCVLALGRHAIRPFLGDVAVEAVHGIPVQDGDRVVLPGYHPAAGMHQVELAAHVQQDFDAFAALLRGELSVRPAVLADQYPNPEYHELTDADLIPTRYLWDSDYLGVDTEGSEARPWGLSLSHTPGTAAVIRAVAEGQLRAFRETLVWMARYRPDFRVLLHNSLHDLPILRRLGIDLIDLGIPFLDTMVLAYQLSTEPQGLKALCIRHAGMAQDSYADLVGPATWAKAVGYLAQVAYDPEPPPARHDYIDFVFEGGDYVAKRHQPTRIDKRAMKILVDVASEKRNKEGELVDPFKRWYQIEPADRLAAEQKFGVLEEATLDDISPDRAVYYSARDADATRRIGPALIERHRAIFGSGAGEAA